MEKRQVKATIKLAGQNHGIMISKERAEQIRLLQKLIRANRNKKENN